MFLPTLALLRSMVWKLQLLEKKTWNGSRAALPKKCDFFRKIAQINLIFLAYTQQCISHLCAKFQRFLKIAREGSPFSVFEKIESVPEFAREQGPFSTLKACITFDWRRVNR